MRSCALMVLALTTLVGSKSPLNKSSEPNPTTKDLGELARSFPTLDREQFLQARSRLAHSLKGIPKENNTHESVTLWFESIDTFQPETVHEALHMLSLCKERYPDKATCMLKYETAKDYLNIRFCTGNQIRPSFIIAITDGRKVIEKLQVSQIAQSVLGDSSPGIQFAFSLQGIQSLKRFIKKDGPSNKAQIRFKEKAISNISLPALLKAQQFQIEGLRISDVCRSVEIIGKQ
jgi:hypothetical protein